jgi:hypothetical protein
MNSIKTENYSDKRFEIVLFVILILMTLPFFILAFFNHPSADDYCIASMIKNNSFWDYQKAIYNTWTGRYFANFAQALYTKNIDLVIASRIIPIFLLSSLLISIITFISVLSKGLLSRLKIALYSLILFVLYLNIFPSTSEGVYWITGATEYLFANILTLFFLSIVIKLNIVEKTTTKIFLTLLAVMLSFMAIGLNEINLCIIFSIIFLTLLYRLYFKQKFSYFNLIILLFILIFCYLDISAPGNYLRAGEFSGKFGLLSSLRISAISVIKLFGIHFQNPSFLLISLVFIPFAITISTKFEIFKNVLRINPFIILVSSLLFIFLLYIPATFSMGINPPMRVHSTIAFVFMMLWFFNIIVFINQVKPSVAENFSINKKLVFVLWIVIIITMMTDFYKEPGQQINYRGNVCRAIYDVTFRACDFNKQMNERYAHIIKAKQAGLKAIEFDELKNAPTTIFFIDVSKEKDHWINSCYSQYYSIDTISLKNQR